MALFIGNSLARGNILDLSEAESAFHPWWDQVQDYITYSLILVGLFALPTANFLMECTILDKEQSSKIPLSYVNKYCTTEKMSTFLTFFPYVLILGPIILVVIERFFTRTTAGTMKLREFFRLIAKATSKDEDTRDWSDQNIYLQSDFMNSNTFYISYIMKNVLEFLVALGFGIWLILQGMNTIILCPDSFSTTNCKFAFHQDCVLEDVTYDCITPNIRFYLSILIFSLVLILIYLCLNFYTFLWLMIKPFRKLSSLIKYHAKHILKEENETFQFLGNQERIVLTALNSPDVDILLDLLAEKMGVEVALRILVLLDCNFGKDWKPNVPETSGVIAKSQSMVVNFSAPIVAKYLEENYRKKLVYVVLLTNLTDAKGKVQKKAFNHFSNNNVLDIESEIPNGNTSASPKPRLPKPSAFEFSDNLFSAKFKDLQPDTEYKIEINVNYNGQLIQTEDIDDKIMTLSTPIIYEDDAHEEIDA